MKKNLIAVILVIFSFAAAAYSQSADEMNKLRIAEALEQAGEYGKALDFYKQLYDASPGNYVYFDGLRRAYMNLKQYNLAERLIQKRLVADPKNVSLYCELGNAYFKAGVEDSAMVAWNNAIEIDPKNPGTYQAVASIMTQNRLFDQAIRVYRRGEETTSYKSGFIIQIARLYFYGMNYRESIRELLRLFASDNKSAAVAYIESQIGGYSASKEAVDAFSAEMKEQVAKHPDDQYIRRVLAFLYMEQKNYTAAYDIYKWLDENTGSKGIELLSFAERAYNDEAYQPAAMAYEEVSHLSKAVSVISRAIMGYANSLRMIGEKDLTEDERPCASDDTLKDLNAALAAYGDIISTYPTTQYLSPAVLNSIEIKMDYFHDTKGSERLLSKYGNFPPEYAQRATLTRIKLYMMEGRFGDALSASLREMPGDSAVARMPAVDANYLSRIRFDAARSLYYLGNFDSASYYLNEITKHPASDAANEAIQLLNLIENNKAAPEALREYAAAGAMEISGRIPEAALQLKEILNDYPQASLAANARFDLGGAYCTMGNVKDALKYYSSLAEDSTGIFADRAQFRIAKIYEVTLHDSSRAVQEYENFLERFPDSIYQDKVRHILRKLLGGNS